MPCDISAGAQDDPEGEPDEDIAPIMIFVLGLCLPRERPLTGLPSFLFDTSQTFCEFFRTFVVWHAVIPDFLGIIRVTGNNLHDSVAKSSLRDFLHNALANLIKLASHGNALRERCDHHAGQLIGDVMRRGQTIDCGTQRDDDFGDAFRGDPVQ